LKNIARLNINTNEFSFALATASTRGYTKIYMDNII